MTIARRGFLVAAGTLASGLPAPFAVAETAPLLERPIPSTGETVPAIGLGTAGGGYESAGSDEALAPLRETIRTFAAGGGRVIDTASTYGDAERAIGRITSELAPAPPMFLATKVDAAGRASGNEQIEQSFHDLRTSRIDLIAVHNLRDTATQLATLRELKRAGRIRYVGVTTSYESQHAALAELMRRETLDFVQIDFALDNRDAAERILPLAQERGMAVMINLPLGRGRLFRAVRGKPLPDWAAAFDCHSWAQFFLKYILSFTVVTCAIPGMSKPEHVTDNLAAARGRLPDEATRRRMETYIDGV
ncbi:MAG: aldo/keto reductase [Acetobacteraceae bacterium]|nr:aldo/keto reductase [Acetobacteraceae bacterium]